MKLRTEVRVSELKNEHNGRNRTYECAPKTARLPAAIIVIFISAQRYNYFLNHQTKKKKKITYRRKKHGKLYKKTQNAS